MVISLKIGQSAGKVPRTALALPQRLNGYGYEAKLRALQSNERSRECLRYSLDPVDASVDECAAPHSKYSERRGTNRGKYATKYVGSKSNMPLIVDKHFELLVSF